MARMARACVLLCYFPLVGCATAPGPSIGYDRVPWRGCNWRGMITAFTGQGRVGQAVTADSLTIASSLK
ncbi:MAG: hypothetical protein WBE80_14720, partial [Methylocella sp.]